MGDRGSNAPMGPVLAAVGGILLAVGSVMTWATASIDLNAFASALGIDPAQIPASAVGETTKSFAGTSSSDGKVALVCGIVAIVLALGAFARRKLSKPFGGLAIIAGLVGGGFALYDISQKSNVVSDAKAAAGPAFASAGLDTSILDRIFKVDLGIGIWMCAAGGAIVVIGGLLLLMRGRGAMATAGGPATFSAPADSGFSPPPTMPTPAMDAPPPPPVAEPAPAPAAEPMPSDPGTGTSTPEGTGGDGTPTG